jgi:putative transposase
MRPSCGVTDIVRDLNAALNIRDKGILELKAPGHSFLLMEAA